MPQRIIDLQLLNTPGPDDYLVITDAAAGQITKKILASVFTGGSSGGGFANAELLTSGNSWLVPEGITQVMVTLVGPGGNGGPANGGDSQSNGSGGNCGEFLVSLYTVTPGDTISYQVGDPSNSSTTFFGSLFAGAGSYGNTGYNGDAASPPGQQDFQFFYLPSAQLSVLNYIQAQGGQSGAYNTDTSSGVGGKGGSNAYGAGGAQRITSGNGNDATLYGAGGGGALNGSTTKTGGLGSRGCIVLRY